MHTPKNTAFFACVLATLFLLTAPVQAAIKCWTNKDGVRECGNVVPPEYSQESHTTISLRNLSKLMCIMVKAEPWR